jgi:uncharacterized protein
VLWLFGGRRREAPPPSAPPKPGEAEARAVVACAHCGLHLPRDEALPGRGGVFCSEAHRATFEREHPGA